MTLSTDGCLFAPFRQRRSPNTAAPRSGAHSAFCCKFCGATAVCPRTPSDGGPAQSARGKRTTTLRTDGCLIADFRPHESREVDCAKKQLRRITQDYAAKTQVYLRVYPFYILLLD